MRQIWIIAKRELNAYFNSLLGYILIIAFLILTGLFTWIVGNNRVFLRDEATLNAMFQIAFWTLFVFVPAITMQLVSDEKSKGTIELILTKPVSDWQFLLGKFIAAELLIIISLVLTLPYYITLASIGPIDHGATICGYLGLILLSSAFVGIGIFTSSLTKNQIEAFLLALFIGIFFQLVFKVAGTHVKGVFGHIFDNLSTLTHYQSVVRGVIDSKDIIYFVSFVFLGLVGAETVLMKRNISDN